MLGSVGVPTELLEPGEASPGQRWPGLRFAETVLHHPGAGHLHAERTVRAQVDLAVAAGARLRERTRVTRVEQRRGEVVVHTDGDEAARAACGRRTSSSRRVRGCRCCSATGSTCSRRRRRSRISPCVSRRSSTAATTAAWPRLVHKGAVELHGLPSGADGGPAPAMKLAQFDSDTVTTAESRDGRIDPRARAVVVERARRWLPGLIPSRSPSRAACSR